jgi:hypothetical protein
MANLITGMWPLGLAVLTAVADEPNVHEGETTVPLVYLMHYAPDAPRNPHFIEELRAAPPDILHVGHAVPLNSIFGPTADYSGWKPRLVPVEEILARKEELRQFVAHLHEAGVSKIICYVNPSIMGGDHVARQGFWAFYDHWQEYERLGIGPKPPRPPEFWMQRERRSFAPWEPEPNYPLWRYQPCPNEAAWLQYQRAVVRLIAECGYDGVFIDDCIMECRDHCAERFSEFSKERASLAVAGSNSRLRNAERYLFWQQSMANFLGDMVRTGQEINPAFFGVPNWGASARVNGAAARARSGKNSAIWRQACHWQLFEEDHPSGSLGSRGALGYLLQYNYGLALGIQPTILSYGNSRQQIELGYAEAAAGGGGAYVQTSASFPEIRSRWHAFYQDHRDLFQGLRLVAPIGLVLSFDEPRYGNDRHLREVFALAQTLYILHIPFAVVPIENLTAEELGRHIMLLAPQLQHLSDGQLTVLRKFLDQGGKLLTDTGCGSHDLLDCARQKNPFPDAQLVVEGAKPPPLDFRKDDVVEVASFGQLISAQEFAVVDALDIREPGVFGSRLRELADQPQDTKAQNLSAPWLEALADGQVAVAEAGPDVRIVIYERLRGQNGVMIAHAIRYGTPIWGGEESAIKPASLELSIPLPAGWVVESAEALTPGGPVTGLKSRINRKTVHCELPPFEYYSMLCLKLAAIGTDRPTTGTSGR